MNQRDRNFVRLCSLVTLNFFNYNSPSVNSTRNFVENGLFKHLNLSLSLEKSKLTLTTSHCTICLHKRSYSFVSINIYEGKFARVSDGDRSNEHSEH